MFNEKTLFRKAKDFDETKDKDIFAKFDPSTRTLPKGFRVDKRYKPTQVEMIFEKDVAVKLRDGVTIYTDIFRPVGVEKVPVIVSWSPYGKNSGRTTMYKMMRKVAGVDDKKLSGLMKWEAVDPDYWCARGYAVAHPDARGAYNSDGNICFFNRQEGEDGYDFVEWLAVQDWCNGKVGTAGNSWLAVAQWFIAAEQPPHLAAIAPWEGFADVYRDIDFLGGIPDTGFLGNVNKQLPGKNMVEDVLTASDNYPLMNDYWESKIADYNKITVPAYVVASYSNTVHSAGTFRAWEYLDKANKWLRIHNSQEWPDFYSDSVQADLLKFFDRYLKGIENSWEETPKVRYAVLDMHSHDNDKVNVPATSFPPQDAKEITYYLDALNGSLNEKSTSREGIISYNSESKDGKAEFTIKFNKDVEFVGYPKIKLWVEADGHDNMDLFVFIQKHDVHGKHLTQMNVDTGVPPVKVITKLNGGTVFRYKAVPGRLRVSLRHINENKSTKWVPYFTFDKKEPLKKGEIVPVVIPFFAMGMRFYAGETLKLVVSGQNLPGGQMPILKGIVPQNKGKHIIHTGGKYASQLQLQVIKKDK